MKKEAIVSQVKIEIYVHKPQRDPGNNRGGRDLKNIQTELGNI